MPYDDEHLDDVQGLARGLHRNREELGEHRDELTESLAELHREPRATFEFTEKEVRNLLRVLGNEDVGVGEVPEGDTAYFKLQQGLAIETGAGGKFCDPS